MAGDPMGLAAGYGAGAVNTTLEDLVRQALLRKQANLEQERLIAAQSQFQQEQDRRRAEMAQQGQQFQQTNQLNQRRVGIDEAQSQREGELQPFKITGLRLAQQGQQFDLGQKQTAAERQAAARGQVDPSLLAQHDALGMNVAPYDTQLGQKEKSRMAEIGATARAQADNAVIPVQTVDDQGQASTVYMTKKEAEGKSFPKPPTAGGGTVALQKARAESAAQMLTRLQEVYQKLQSGEGPSQLVRGIASATGGRLNLNNAATEYQKLRKATAVALAVAIQGSRPSDADAEAMAQLLPDFTTPAEVAGNLFESSKKQLLDVAGNMAGATGRPVGSVQNRMGAIDQKVTGSKGVLPRAAVIARGQQLGMTEEQAIADATAKGYDVR